MLQPLLSPRRFARLPKDHPPQLLVVVDTEEEFAWGEGFSREATTVRAMAGIPALQRLFEEYGVRPTYVIDYPVATQPEAFGPLKEFHERGQAVIGAHLHPWVNPPYEEELSNRNSYAANLGPRLEREKLAALTEAIERSIGVRPTIYKAGRYGIGPATPSILEALGYEIDLSVAPRMDLRPDGGPDFMSFPPEPYWFGETRPLLEIPVSADFVGWLAPFGPVLRRFADSRLGHALRVQALLGRSRALNRLRISPEGMTTEQHQRLTRTLLRRGVRVFTMSFHSTSAAPGFTPYVRTDADLQRFHDRCRRYLDFFMGELNGKPTTPRNLYANLSA